MGGGAVTLALPFLDCFLNTNGTALLRGHRPGAAGGVWHLVPGAGLQPRPLGAQGGRRHGYENNVELKVLDPFRDKINI